MQVAVEFVNPFPVDEFELRIDHNVLTMTRSVENIRLYAALEVITKMDEPSICDAILTLNSHPFQILSTRFRPGDDVILIAGVIQNTARSSLAIKFTELTENV